ncbi:MAG: hypothetical protein QXK03_02885 [Archaeoglobaceae archaeon]
MNSRVRKIPIWLGNVIEIIGISIAFYFLFLSLNFVSFKKLLFLLISWTCFWYFTHCLAHYVVGKLFGIEFLYYYIGKSAILKLKIPIFKPFKLIPVLGLKTKPESVKRISKKKVAIFYASGALFSMFSPAITLLFATEFFVFLFLLILTLSNIFFTLIFSPKIGDFWKVKNIRTPEKS